MFLHLINACEEYYIAPHSYILILYREISGDASLNPGDAIVIRAGCSNRITPASWVAHVSAVLVSAPGLGKLGRVVSGRASGIKLRQIKQTDNDVF